MQLETVCSDRPLLSLTPRARQAGVHVVSEVRVQRLRLRGPDAAQHTTRARPRAARRPLWLKWDAREKEICPVR